MRDFQDQPASHATVLDAIRAAGSASRVELAAATGFTQATISTAVRSLIDDGLVVETGERTRTRGKPRVLLQLNSRARCGIGVQLAADTVAVAIVDAVGSLIARTRLAGAHGRDPAEMLRAIARAIHELVETTGIPRAHFVGICVAAPGVIDTERGRILRSRSLERWVDLPLTEILGTLTGSPVSLENDATSAAAGESWRGHIGSSIAHCTLHMGAAIGGGFVLGGKPYLGASSNTGALGAMPARSADGRISTLEESATPAAVVERAHTAISRGAHSSITSPSDGDWLRDFEAISSAAIHGDPLAISLIEQSAEHLADALLTVTNVLDLDSVSLTGSAFTIAGTLYLRVIQSRLTAGSFARPNHTVRVRLSEQPIDAAAVGAASLVLHRHGNGSS